MSNKFAARRYSRDQAVIAAEKLPVVFAVGYSVRALVEACWHAGLESVAVDHFGDADTRRFANDRWIEFQLSKGGLMSIDTRNAIHAAVTEFVRAGNKVVFLLAGGMENLGGAVEQLREITLVLGPTEEQRRSLRDIEFLNDAARGSGIQTPRLRYARISDSGWLWKPPTSAGGLGIVRSESAGFNLELGYWQEYIAGEQIGVGCVIGQSKCKILGATSSFDAADWPGPLEFIYRGSFGPIALSAACRSQIARVCTHIRDRIGYFGWLQFDFIRDQHGGLWLLECNPRWTAGMEIFLLAGGANPVRELLASNSFHNLTQSVDLSSGFECFAKAIVYATQPVYLTDELIAKLNRMEGLADRPYAPQLIEARHPIATVRAGLKYGDASQMEVENRLRLLDELRERADRVTSLIGESQ